MYMYASDRQRHKCNAKTWTQLSECTWNACTFQSRLKEAIPRLLNNVFLSNLCHNIFFPVETGFEHSVLELFCPSISTSLTKTVNVMNTLILI